MLKQRPPQADEDAEHMSAPSFKRPIARSELQSDLDSAPAWSEQRSADRGAGLRTALKRVDRILVAATGAVLVGILCNSYGALALTALAFLVTNAIVRPDPPWRRLVGFAQFAFEAVPPALALMLLLMIAGITGFPQLDLVDVAIVLSITSLIGIAVSRLSKGRSDPSPMRIAVIGSVGSTYELSQEIAFGDVTEYEVVGRISYEDGLAEADSQIPLLGTLAQLGQIVVETEIDLLVMTREVPRVRVFEEVASTCLHLPVQLMELTGFYENVFGHVPVAEINAAWFQYIMHPRYNPVTPYAKRALDLFVAVVLGIAILPVMAICALLIRRDGGPALFKQTRIGEGGKKLTVYKLRTMVVDAGLESQWASPDDPRITRVGAVLRKLHLDEFPQLVNVVRGEMSMVGPRPEQPEFVERLEGLLPFYSRRHLIKPGITGWAQVRCGYAGSDIGSAWKLCHDLYYLKYRSMAFDLCILTGTLGTVLGAPRAAVDLPGDGLADNVTTSRLQESLVGRPPA